MVKIFNGKMFKRDLHFVDNDEQLSSYIKKIETNDYIQTIPVLSISCNLFGIQNILLNENSLTVNFFNSQSWSLKKLRVLMKQVK